MKKILIKAAALLSLFLASVIAQADISNNKIVVSKINNRCLSVDYYLSPVFTLHRILSPQMAWDVFFDTYTIMNQAAFKNEIAKISSALSSSSKISDLEGRPFVFANWKWPDPQSWLQTLKEENILFMSGANSQGHAKPVEFHAEACTNQAISSVLLSFDTRLYPIDLIAGENYQLSLTKETIFTTAEFY